MKKTILFSLLLLSLISFVNAEQDASIQILIANNSIQVAGLIEVDMGGLFGMQRLPAFFIDKINETISTEPIRCDSVQITEGNITNTYQTNCTLNLWYQKELDLNFNNTQSIYTTESDTERTLNRCLEERGNYLGAFTACGGNLAKLEGVETNLTTCQTSLSSCNNEKSSLQSAKTTLETEKEEKKNQRWSYGIGGIIIGIAVTLGYYGKLGGIKVKRPEDEYNVRQAK